MKNKQLLLSTLLLLYLPFSFAGTYIGLFGDLTVQDNEDTPLSGDSYSGILDLYATHQFSDEVTGLIEFVYQNSEHVEEEEIERLWLRYSIADQFNISVGRFHSLIGKWNKEKHHGALLQNTISRPFFLEFEGSSGIMPLHVVGLMADGILKTKNININYEFSLHGSQSVRAVGAQNHFEIEPNIFLSGSIDPGFSARIELKNIGSPWYIAFFLVKNDIKEPGDLIQIPGGPTTDDVISQSIVGTDMGAQLLNWNISAEFFHISNNDTRNSVSNFLADAYFTQATYQLNETIKLTYRFSGISVDENDPYFQIFSMQDQNHHIANLRYDINDEHAIKFEIDYADYSGNIISNTTTLKLQWAFLLH